VKKAAFAVPGFSLRQRTAIRQNAPRPFALDCAATLWHDAIMLRRALPLILLASLTLAACIPQAATNRPRPASDVRENQSTMIDLLLDDRVTGGDPAPTWTMASVNPNAQNVAASRYTVRPGDTLRAIGDATGAGSEAIALENALAPPFTLVPGQQLAIPAGLYHRVAAGETGIAIARAYGVSWGDVIGQNALTEPYILRIGQRLRLPGDARAADGVGLADRAARFSLDIDAIATGSQPALADGSAPTAPSAARRAPVTTAIAAPASFSGKFQWPIAGPIIARFGPLAPGKVNDGINIAAPAGTPIRAAADGVVAYAGDQIGVYGGLILINHGGGWVSAYGHAERLDVQRGQSVKGGDIIAAAGATGQVQSSQLHFQLRRGRTPVDPVKQLPPR
jgi:murein DD-endopeptidase MepM/ murein hydrolase activator NlpD